MRKQNQRKKRFINFIFEYSMLEKYSELLYIKINTVYNTLIYRNFPIVISIKLLDLKSIWFEKEKNEIEIRMNYNQLEFENNKCFQLNILNVYCIFIFVSSILFNSTLLLTFYSNKNLRTTYNVFIIALAALNLVSTFTELPFVIFSNYHCKYI